VLRQHHLVRGRREEGKRGIEEERHRVAREADAKDQGWSLGSMDMKVLIIIALMLAPAIGLKTVLLAIVGIIALEVILRLSTHPRS
jgi:hypothetical protein